MADVTGKPPYYSAALAAMRRFVGADEIAATRVTADFIDGYVHALLVEGVSRNSARSYLRALRSIYNKQVKASLIQPTDAFDHLPAILDQSAASPLTEKELAELFNFARPLPKALVPVRVLFAFSVLSGLSFSEMKQLTTGMVCSGRIVLDDGRMIPMDARLKELCRALGFLPVSPESEDVNYLLPAAQRISEIEYNNGLARLSSLLHMRTPIDDATASATRSLLGIGNSASVPVSFFSKTLHATPRSPRFWRVVRNHTYADREDIRKLIFTVAAGTKVFIPEVMLYRRNRAGKIRKTPDRLLKPLLFARLSASEAARLQNLMGFGATIFFTRNGRNKVYSAISNREMANFSLAVGSGLGELEEYSASGSFHRGQRVRVVGHQLFDGLEGEIDADSKADELSVKVVLTGGGLVFFTAKIPRCQIRVI